MEKKKREKGKRKRKRRKEKNTEKKNQAIWLWYKLARLTTSLLLGSLGAAVMMFLLLICFARYPQHVVRKPVSQETYRITALS